MKNTQVGNRGKQCYAAIKNNAEIINAMCSRVDENGKIYELLGAQADSEIADVLLNCIQVLAANTQAGAGTYSEATGIYKVFVNAYTSNSVTVPVEVASLDFSYFIDIAAADGTLDWTTLSAADNTVFLAKMAKLVSDLDQFSESVGPFAA